MHEIVISTRCPVCKHGSKGHKFDSVGKTRCPECPQEVCGAYEENVPSMLGFGELTTMGIKPINEMTDRELVEEIMHAQYVALTSAQFDVARKRRMVAEIRVSSAKVRIYREAGVDPSSGFWGSW